jgi:hypothetical protein
VHRDARYDRGSGSRAPAAAGSARCGRSAPVTSST